MLPEIPADVFPPRTCCIRYRGSAPCGDPVEERAKEDICERHDHEIHWRVQKATIAAIHSSDEWKAMMARPPRDPRDREHVYYVRVADRVKIGFSRNVYDRVASIPCDELLAVEPGGRPLEQMRHKQFAALRIYRNREWFRHEGELRSHVEMLLDHFGPPEKLLRAA
jgi:hypothetical protein